jgi:hypothetical protein
VKIAVAGGSGLVGRHTVEAVRRSGHAAVVLARSAGVDLTSGAGLPAALDGVEAGGCPEFRGTSVAAPRIIRPLPPPPEPRTDR